MGLGTIFSCNVYCVYICAWCLHYVGSATPQKIDSWLTCDGTGETIDDSNIMKIVGHDIYAIGTQV